MSPDIVVVNFRSAPLILRTVTLVREFAGEEARLIVVDNSPGDGAAEIVRAAAPDATIITNSVNRGFAAAVNKAVAVAEAEIVCLLNPDVQRISGCYADIAAAFREPRVAAVATRLRNADGTEQPNCFRAPRPFDLLSEDLALAERFPRWQQPRYLRIPEWTEHDPRRIDWAAGACLFLRRAALADVGPFDERFFLYWEETDWLLRAKQRGWQTVSLPTVEAVHVSGGSSPNARSPQSCSCSRVSTTTRRSTSGRRRRRSSARRSSESTRCASPVTHSAAEGRRGPPRQTASASTSRRARPDPRSQWTSPTNPRSTPCSTRIGGASRRELGTSSRHASGYSRGGVITGTGAAR